MAWIERRPSGRYQGLYRNANKKIRSAGTFDHKRTALKVATDREVEQRKLGAVDPDLGKIKWIDWFNMWHGSRILADSTRAEYPSIVKNHITPTFGEMALRDIDKIKIGNWITTMEQGGKSPFVIRVALDLLRTSLQAAKDNKRIGSNPAYKMKGPDLPEGLERYLTVDEVMRISHHINSQLNRVILWTAVSSGLRFGELAGLHPSDIHLDRKLIHVTRQYDQKAKMVKALKDKHQRFVPIPDDVVTMLRAHLADIRRTGPCGVAHKPGFRCPGGALVFAGPRGAPLASNAWNVGPWKRALADAEIIGRVRPHDLRHTFASWLIRTVSIPDLARVMGHSSWEVTQKYAHLGDEGDDAVRTAMAGTISRVTSIHEPVQARRGVSRRPVKRTTARGAKRGAHRGVAGLSGTIRRQGAQAS